MCNFVYSSIDNLYRLSMTPGTYCRCDVSAFDLRRSMRRLLKIDDRCVDFRRSMCRPSESLGAAEGHGFCCRASLTLRLYDSAWKRGFLTVFETFCRHILDQVRDRGLIRAGLLTCLCPRRSETVFPGRFI